MSPAETAPGVDQRTPSASRAATTARAACSSRLAPTEKEIWYGRWYTANRRLNRFGATLMAISFHLASGDNHPWLIPADGFDETIDVDTVLSFIQVALFIFSANVLVRIRREQRAT